MKLYNPIGKGADIKASDFTFLMGTTLRVSDVPGLAIKKQWGFLEEVEDSFEAPVIEAPKAPKKEKKVAVEPEPVEIVPEPIVEAEKPVVAKKPVKKSKK